MKGWLHRLVYRHWPEWTYLGIIRYPEDADAVYRCNVCGRHQYR